MSYIIKSLRERGSEDYGWKCGTGEDCGDSTVNISMVRKNLDDIPFYELPGSYQIRWYHQGDEKIWFEIQKRADKLNPITPDLFKRQFGDDPQLLHERQCFLYDTSGIPVGTATAWFNKDYRGEVYGRLHWVAIIPAKQGKGLAKPLLTTVCRRMKELQHDKAYLTTSTLRIPAINLYLKFGFVPEIKNEQDFAAWKIVEQKMGKKLIIDV